MSAPAAADKPEGPRTEPTAADGPSTLTSTCHCKAVEIHFPKPTAALNECRCGICRKYGALWAYFPPEKVRVEGETETYSYGDKVIDFHRCLKCGCVTHWTLIESEGATEMGVNANMLEKDELYKLERAIDEDGPQEES